MDQFSFHGPFAYRWINDVPVERIDLRSGERLPVEVGGFLPDPVADGPSTGEPDHSGVRAAMAAWN
ncbi:MAG: hypothetical protein VKO19_05985 [Cyanobacteriota bacterium]|jgi:hypothetical protein|nr:hypothetical protein [Cyanobacteriota bacterium]